MQAAGRESHWWGCPARCAPAGGLMAVHLPGGLWPLVGLPRSLWTCRASGPLVGPPVGRGTGDSGATARCLRSTRRESPPKEAAELSAGSPHAVAPQGSPGRAGLGRQAAHLHEVCVDVRRDRSRQQRLPRACGRACSRVVQAASRACMRCHRRAPRHTGRPLGLMCTCCMHACMHACCT